jgi:nigerose phosphorylase
MTWEITEKDQLDAQAVDRLGNKLLLGNGYLGYRGTLEEYGKEQKTATIVSGLYDKVGDAWREPINLPNGCFVQVSQAGAPLHALTAKVLEHEQSLDMKQALHVRRTVFEAKDGARITVSARRFISLARQRMICLEYVVEADRACEVTLQSGIDGDVWDLNGPHLDEIVVSEEGGVLSLSAVTHELRVPVAVSEWQETNGAKVRVVRSEQKISRELALSLQPGRPVRVWKVAAHVIGLDSTDPLVHSRAACREAAELGFEALLSEHAALWAERWAQCDVQIGGDEAAEQALRFSMYHLLAIAPTHTESASIPARGLSGQVYKGGIFWDTEIFMLPFFAHAFPALARNLLLYRHHTLDGARRKAAEYGFRGAFFAWESQDTGDDACTLFNVTDVFTNRPMRTYFRDKQVHISADVAYAFWQYFTLTGDASIWSDGGAEVVFECARFFLSYVYFSPDKQRYEVLDVTGPDEYHERVHNNAFTNLMVAHTFDVCLRVAAELQAKDPSKLAALLSALAFERDLERIREVQKSVFVPGPNAAGVIPQFDGYFALEDASLAELKARKQHPHEYLGGGNGLATSTQVLKQADLVLAMYLFGEQFSLETKAKNWEYYEPRTEHGSSLSACSYSLIAAQIGKIDWAYKYFLKTATIDLTGDSKQYVGTLYIGGTHPAANGGAWMSAVFGLCGLRCAEETVAIEPRLPAHWTRVALPFTFRGQALRVELSHDSVKVRALGELTVPLSIVVGGARHALPKTGELSVSLR